jgi:clan AA aspartic protease
MGETFAQLRITNLFTRARVEIRALVDTGAAHMILTDPVARQLGFDPDEFAMKRAWLADGSNLRVPAIGPIEIAFEDRSCQMQAIVMGDQCLLGFIPLEAMDLIVDPKQQRLVGRHPGGPLFLAKGHRISPASLTPGSGTPLSRPR